MKNIVLSLVINCALDLKFLRHGPYTLLILTWDISKPWRVSGIQNSYS